jgi:predicted enzyme related to lactoylglutathione lyase
MAHEEKKGFTIYVEGTAHPWSESEISYSQVVKFEFPDYSETSGINYSVTYKRGHGDKPEGILVPGASVKVKDEMRFYVSKTGQS